MLAFGSNSFITEALSLIFIRFIDYCVYSLLAYTYNIYVGLTKLDLFGGNNEAAKALYNNFSSQIYRTIAVIMIFIFAYRLLLYIMDPDGSKMPDVKTSKFIKGILFSVVLVIVMPVIFKYMGMFQYHVVSEDTIPNIILDTNATSINSGKQLAMITLMGFYHPYGTKYNTCVNATDATECSQIINMQSGDEIKERWSERMLEWCESDGYAPTELLGDEELRKAIGDDETAAGVEYFWVICTACGVLVIYFILMYAIAVGTRAVRLGVLQLIAPIPILLRMFDKKYYDPWFAEIKKTYLELFMRIAIIAFTIKVCTMVPIFIDIIFGA